MSSYRNKFEAKCGATFGPSYEYETIKLSYTTPHTYTPDFTDVQGKRIIETKGWFPPSDRAKMLAVKRDNPDWTIALCFQNPETKISKKSKTTYRQWAEKHGFEVVPSP